MHVIIDHVNPHLLLAEEVGNTDQAMCSVIDVLVRRTKLHLPQQSNSSLPRLALLTCTDGCIPDVVVVVATIITTIITSERADRRSEFTTTFYNYFYNYALQP